MKPMKPMIPPSWNVFESERDFDSDFFSGSPYNSRSFLLNTVALCIDLGLGASIGLAYWIIMPGMTKILYLLLMAGLPIVWLRMRRDHRKMRAWYSAAPRELADSYPVRMASHLINFAPYYLYFLVLILLFCLAGTLRHEAKLTHLVGHQTTETPQSGGWNSLSLMPSLILPLSKPRTTSDTPFPLTPRPNTRGCRIARRGERASLSTSPHLRFAPRGRTDCGNYVRFLIDTNHD
jgi:hypothetical protein